MHNPTKLVKGPDGVTYEVTRRLDEEHGNFLDARHLSKVVLGSGQRRRLNTASLRVDAQPSSLFKSSAGSVERPFTRADVGEFIDIGLHAAMAGRRLATRSATSTQIENIDHVIRRYGQWVTFNSFNLYPEPPYALLAEILGIERGARPERQGKRHWERLADELSLLGQGFPLKPEELNDLLTIHVLSEIDGGGLAEPQCYRRDNASCIWLFGLVRDRLTNARHKPWSYPRFDQDGRKQVPFWTMRAVFMLGFERWREGP